MERILLLVDNKHDRKLIEEALDYEIWPAETEHALDQNFELAIIDGPSLKRWRSKCVNAAARKSLCCCHSCWSPRAGKVRSPCDIWERWWMT